MAPWCRPAAGEVRPGHWSPSVSEETHRAVEEAIRAHVSDETGGGYLTAWTLAAAAVSPAATDETHYIYANHDGAPHEWLGLQAMAHRRAMRWEAGDGE